MVKPKSVLRPLAVVWILSGIVLTAAQAQQPSPQTDAATARSAALQQKGRAELAQLPLIFEKNMGQASPKASFLSTGDGYGITLSPAGVGFLLHKNQNEATELHMSLAGANASAQISGDAAVPGIKNYLYGKDPSKWVTKVPNFERVKVTDALPGIDVVYYGNRHDLEYDFDVAPAADPQSILLRFDGAKSLHLDTDGDLLVETAAGPVRLKQPHAYQLDGNSRSAIAVKFTVAKNGDVSFALGDYDHSRTLVIDPTISYSTFWAGGVPLGSTYIGYGPFILGMGVDGSGAAYIYGLDEGDQLSSVGGLTLGNGCPVTNGCLNLFVTKFDPGKSGAASLVYTTLIPTIDLHDFQTSTTQFLYEYGSQDSLLNFPVQGLAVDASGNAFFTGGTDNPDYPTTSTAYQSTCFLDASTNDPSGDFCVPTGYVTELSTDGSTIEYSTLLGSTKAPVRDTYITSYPAYFDFPAWGTSIAVDSAHMVYLGAYSYNGFPNTTSYACNYGGVSYITPPLAADCASEFAVKLDTTKSGSSALIYSIPYSAAVTDMVVATDGAGNLYWSSFGCDSAFQETTLGGTPITYNGYQTTPPSTGYCVGIHKLNSTGSMVYASYLYGAGASGLLRATLTGIAADPDGRAYLAGITQDILWPNVNGLPSPTVSVYGGPGYGFLSAFDTAQTGAASLLYSTLMDGASNQGSGVAAFTTNGCGSAALVGGDTSSTFPLVNPLSGTGEPSTYLNGYSVVASIFDTKLSGASSLTFSTAIPGGMIVDYASLNQLGSLYMVSGTIGGTWGAENMNTNYGIEPNQDINHFAITSNAYQMAPTEGGTPGYYSNTSTIRNPAFQVISEAIAPGCYTETPSALAFNSQAINTISTSQAITFTNTASVQLNFNSIAASSGFAETDNCSPSIAKNASCTVNVTFRPTATGPQMGTLTFTDTDATVTQVVNLTGTGMGAPAPLVQITPASLSFGGQAGGVTSPAQTFTLSNPGNATLNISGISIAGATPGAFAETSTCGATLLANASCTIAVTFTPSSTASATASISIADNATGTPQTAGLSGNGVTFQSNVGAATAQQAVTLYFTTAGTLSSIQTLTSGAANLDFTQGTTGTCATGTMYAIGQTCSVNVIFTPQFAGVRNGAVLLTDGSGNALATTYLAGSATGPQIVFAPAKQSSLLTQGQHYPNGIAIDGSGNVYITDSLNSLLVKLPKSGSSYGAEIDLGTGFNQPVGVAIDGAGNIYVGDYANFRVVKIPWTGSAYGTQIVIPLGGVQHEPEGMAVDGNGNLYFADYASGGAVIEVPMIGDSFGAPITLPFTGINSPNGVAVDSSGDVFVANSFGSNILELLRVGSGFGAQIAISTGTASPNSVAVDPNGNLYVCEGVLGGSGTLVEIPKSGGTYGMAVTIPVQGLSSPYDVVLDAAGNIYIAAASNDQAFKLDRVDAPALTFAGTSVGSTSTDSPQTVSVANIGNASLTFATPPTGSNPSYPANFPVNSKDSILCAASTPLAAGASCDVSVNFTPTASGTLSSSVMLTDNDLNGSGVAQAIAVSGMGLAPAALLTPNPVSFGNQTVNTTGGSMIAVLSNSGNGALTISGVTITGTNPTDFAIDPTHTSCGATLAANSTCNIAVTFTPASTTGFTAMLSVADNASGSPHTTALTGTGTPVAAPVAGLAPNPVPFGNETVGSTSSAMLAVLSNTGNATLNISSVTIGAAGAADFAINPTLTTCGSTLAANSTCNIAVTFTPASATGFTATLSVADNASGSPHSISLTGIGTPVPAPIAALSPNPVAFGNTAVNTTATLPITLSNTGNAPLAISSVSITGTNASLFTETSACGSSLAANSACTISVSFTPTTAAPFTATLNVATNAAGSPQSTMLTGTGTGVSDYTLSAPNGSVSVQPGAVAQFTIDVNALSGNYAQPVALTITGLPSGATASFNPASVTPGSTGAQSVLTVQTPTYTSSLAKPHTGNGTNPAAWIAALLPLFFLRKLRRRFAQLSTSLRVLLLAALTLGSAASLSGCGGGYFGPAPQTVTLTIAGSSGQLQHSTTVSLTIQ